MLNEHFGNKDDLTNLVKAAHAKDMFVMVEVNVNNAGPTTIDKVSQVIPFNETMHYHKECQVDDWDN